MRETHFKTFLQNSLFSNVRVLPKAGFWIHFSSFLGFFDLTCESTKTKFPKTGFLRYFCESKRFFDPKQLDQTQKRQFCLVFRCFLSKVFENCFEFFFKKNLTWESPRSENPSLQKKHLKNSPLGIKKLPIIYCNLQKSTRTPSLLSIFSLVLLYFYADFL